MLFCHQLLRRSPCKRDVLVYCSSVVLESHCQLPASETQKKHHQKLIHQKLHKLHTNYPFSKSISMVSSWATKSKSTVFTFVLNPLLYHVQLNVLDWMSKCPTATVTHCHTTLHVNNWYLINLFFCVTPVHVFHTLHNTIGVFRENCGHWCSAWEKGKSRKEMSVSK